jgi:tRNA(His) guanylyltransferase
VAFGRSRPATAASSFAPRPGSSSSPSSAMGRSDRSVWRLLTPKRPPGSRSERRAPIGCATSNDGSAASRNASVRRSTRASVTRSAPGPQDSSAPQRHSFPGTEGEPVTNVEESSPRSSASKDAVEGERTREGRGAEPSLCDTLRLARETVSIDDLEKRMGEFEWFRDLRVLPATWPVIRVDGRSFTRLCDEHFERPFDVRFHDIMVKVAQALLLQLQGLFAFTESDEISVLLPAHTDLFGRGVEKLVSISAGIASSRFTRELGTEAHFDSHVWVGPSVQHVVDYFRWRQSNAARCSLNAWCYWALRKDGRNVHEATVALETQSVAEKNELLFARGINFNEVPLWQKHGVGVYWDTVQRGGGFNPAAQEESTTLLRRIRIDKTLPRGDAFGELVSKLIARSTPSVPPPPISVR